MANTLSEGERLRLAVDLLAAALTSVATYLKRSPEMEARDAAARIVARIEALDRLTQGGTTRCRE